jgi:trehalose 6-phosphate synthase/phosphatase
VFERLLTAYSDPDFIFAAGDDRTDEDLFERLPAHAWTVHVGPGATRASFVTADFQSLRRLLTLIAETRDARRPS